MTNAITTAQRMCPFLRKLSELILLFSFVPPFRSPGLDRALAEEANRVRVRPLRLVASRLQYWISPPRIMRVYFDPCLL